MELSYDWKVFLEAVGGATKLLKLLKTPQTTFYRASRGLTSFSDEDKASIAIVAKLYDVKNPLESAVRPRVKDLSPLRVFGESLKAKANMLLDIYPPEQLLELAESENTPEDILRAVTYLLES